MFFIPTWITNIILLITVYVAGFQHVQLKRPNPVTNLQFVMIAFALVMMLITVLYNEGPPWRSDIFFLISITCLAVIIRQHRMLPPMKPFQ